MDIDLFDFDLPPERIAQQPLADRAAARLLRLDRTTGAVAHHRVADLPRLLRPDDLLVLNNTAVVPARLALRRTTGGRVEGLFLRELNASQHTASETQQAGPSSAPAPSLRWVALLNSKGRLRLGETLTAEADAGVALTVAARTEAGPFELAVAAEGTTFDVLRRIGRTPLPPYIRRTTEQPGDRERYQTVFASKPGAVAAPTAGLHFTAALLEELRARGVERTQVTLHVGLGTFEPVRVQQIETHRMHSEWFDCPTPTAEAINAARAAGRRIVAVGTTSVRVVESCFDDALGGVRPRTGWTDIFIHPGCRFRAIDALLTNFHLPRSTLLMLVSALAGRERIMEAYRQAVAAGYRFFSYGDAMLIE